MGATVEVGHLLECMGHRRQPHTHPSNNHGRIVALLLEKYMQVGVPQYCMCWTSGR
jgi:hypothetical protein